MLKVAFPVNVRAMNATYEMQFGCVERPTHFNTRYDLARYEVPGHKWSDLSEHGFGVALLSESKYGYSTFANVMRLSLLRAAQVSRTRGPTWAATNSYGLMPHAGTGAMPASWPRRWRFNAPVLFAPGTADAQRCRSHRWMIPTSCSTRSNGPRTTSRSCCGSTSVTRRSRGTANVTSICRSNRPRSATCWSGKLVRQRCRRDRIQVPYAPFKIISVKLRR